jgi:hypothetical protein
MVTRRKVDLLHLGARGIFQRFQPRFDPSLGKPTGDATQITHFNDPGFMLTEMIPKIGFSIVRDRLMLTMSQRSARIWVSDGVNR